MAYSWPGNIRELENVIERGIILTQGPMIVTSDLPDFLNHTKEKELLAQGNNQLKLKDALRDPEKDLILKALESVDWNRNEAAKSWGLIEPRSTRKCTSWDS